MQTPATSQITHHVASSLSLDTLAGIRWLLLQPSVIQMDVGVVVSVPGTASKSSRKQYS